MGPWQVTRVVMLFPTGLLAAIFFVTALRFAVTRARNLRRRRMSVSEEMAWFGWIGNSSLFILWIANGGSYEDSWSISQARLIIFVSVMVFTLSSQICYVAFTHWNLATLLIGLYAGHINVLSGKAKAEAKSIVRKNRLVLVGSAALTAIGVVGHTFYASTLAFDTVEELWQLIFVVAARILAGGTAFQLAIGSFASRTFATQALVLFEEYHGTVAEVDIIAEKIRILSNRKTFLFGLSQALLCLLIPLTEWLTSKNFARFWIVFSTVSTGSTWLLVLSMLRHGANEIQVQSKARTVHPSSHQPSVNSSKSIASDGSSPG